MDLIGQCENNLRILRFQIPNNFLNIQIQRCIVKNFLMDATESRCPVTISLLGRYDVGSVRRFMLLREYKLKKTSKKSCGLHYLLLILHLLTKI